MEILLWLLAAASVITVAQRLVQVRIAAVKADSVKTTKAAKAAGESAP